MPIHDWTRVGAGTFHAFHLSWISELQVRLNGGVLPPEFYAQAEQVIGPFGPDVLTLQVPGPEGGAAGEPDTEAGLALAVTAPRTRLRSTAETDLHARRRNTLVIRHASGDRIVALVEIVSPGNKNNRHGVRTFVEKAIDALDEGFHLLILDLFPPTPRDPNGIHGLVWEELTGEGFAPPEGEPLTLVAYAAGRPIEAYIEPTAVGRELIDMPLFLLPDRYVNVPLEDTYRAAYRGVPRRWKAVLEA